MNTIEEIDLLFKSGNDVPVTRATITLEQWEAVKEEIERKCHENYLDGYEAGAIGELTWK